MRNKKGTHRASCFRNVDERKSCKRAAEEKTSAEESCFYLNEKERKLNALEKRSRMWNFV